jgi:hypothetical protein
MVILSDDFATVEIGSRRIMIEATAFDQHHATAPAKEPARGGLAGRTRSDDRDVGGYRFGRFSGAINPHSSPVSREYNG